ncbi:MAG: oligopeptide/dipeptide ABC transporter ATP-binding protein, partial [Burkholderiales bacterium]
VLITHNMGVVADMAQRVAVMYAGQVMEQQGTRALFAAPQHPYTAALLAARPETAAPEGRLATIAGVVPGLHDRPTGCLFAPRCAWATARCVAERPALLPTADSDNAAHADQAAVRCHYPLGRSNRLARIADDGGMLRSGVAA